MFSSFHGLLTTYLLKKLENQLQITVFFVNQKVLSTYILIFRHRHSSIYAINVGTHKKKRNRENRVNRGYLFSSTKGEENRIEL